MEENHEVMWTLRKSPDAVVCVRNKYEKGKKSLLKSLFYTHTILFKELQTLKPLENVLNFTFLLTHSTHSFNIYVLILKRLVMVCAAYIGIGGMKIENEPRH